MIMNTTVTKASRTTINAKRNATTKAFFPLADSTSTLVGGVTCVGNVAIGYNTHKQL